MNTIRRKIGFHVDPDGSVSPAIPQYGGVKGEHNVTTLSMTLSASAPYCEGDLVRLRFAGGDGSVLSSDLITDYIVQDGRMVVSYALPAVLTRVGGQLGVRLVLSSVDESGTETETFLSSEAVLWFDEAPTENGTPFWTGVSEMLKRTTAATDAAVAARDAARNEKEAAQADADRAEKAADGAREAGLRAVEAASDAASQAQALGSAAAQVEQNQRDILTLTQFVYSLQSQKLQKSGHAPNKTLVTDADGNVVTGDGAGGYALTEADKAAIIAEVLAQIPSGDEVMY